MIVCVKMYDCRQKVAIKDIIGDTSTKNKERKNGSIKLMDLRQIVQFQQWKENNSKIDIVIVT